MTDRFIYDNDYISAYECKTPEYNTVSHDHINTTRYQKVAENTYAMTHKENTATITCVGDMLCEKNIYSAYCNGETARFHDIFQFVHPILSKADLAIGSLNTCICNNAPYTGEQPRIEGHSHHNAPQAFLDAIRDAGFDLLITANNHALDCGLRGALETIDRVEEAGMMRTGLFRPEEPAHYTIAQVNGIRVAVLAYSTWSDTLRDNLTEEGREKILSEFSPQRAEKDIAAAKTAGAEFIITYIHWDDNTAYQSVPTDRMKQMAQILADAGSDYIIGIHPFSLMSFDMIPSSDGRRVPLIYSMGNFVSGEMAETTRASGLLQLRLEKENGVVRITSEDFSPCYMPDSFCGIAFPVIPEGFADIASTEKKALQDGHSQAKGLVGSGRSMEKPTASLYTGEICRILGLPLTLPNELYTTINYAEDTREGGVAIISDITSDPAYITPEDRIDMLASLAMEKGAKLLISTRQIADYPCLIVDDVFDAYVTLTTAVRHRFDPKTISITGSIGKTTTTEMVYSIISSTYNTHRNTSSANNVWLASSVIQNLTHEHEYYVQETMEGPPYGAASTIAKMVQPQAAIVTVVGTSHLEAFDSQERILESCLGVQDGMPEDGLLILNGDDPFQWKAQTHCKAIYYSIDNPEADYIATNIRSEDDALLFDICYGEETVPICLHCFGRHNILNATAAFAAGKWAGVTDEQIASALNQYRTSGIRQNLVRYGGYRLYLDCYNAAPESIQSSLDALSMIPHSEGGHYIGVLADVLEVGDKAENIHRAIGRTISSSPLDLLICYGKDAAYIAEEAVSNTNLPVYSVENEDELISLLRGLVTREDVVLFKGSHGMALERIVDKTWGTWFHEVYDGYEFRTHLEDDENLSYRIHPDHATVIGKHSSTSDVVIPDTISGVPVTGVADNAFLGSAYTKSVTFSNNLVNIRYCSFYNAKRLSRITIPASVRIIDRSAFNGCSKLKTVSIKDGCTHIGYRAFSNCPALERVEIPATVRQIDDEAFLNCGKLKIYGVEGSYAQTYAAENKIPFLEKKSQ